MRGSETHYSANHNTYRICCPLQFCLLQREIVSHMLAAFLHDKLTHQFAKLARNEKPQPRSAKDYVSLKPQSAIPIVSRGSDRTFVRILQDGLESCDKLETNTLTDTALGETLEEKCQIFRSTNQLDLVSQRSASVVRLTSDQDQNL